MTQVAAAAKLERKAYPYTDAAGQIAFEVWYFNYAHDKHQKQARQRRPSGEADGSWLWGLDAGEFMRTAPDKKNWLPFNAAKFEQYPATRQRKFFDTAAPVIPYRLRELKEAVGAGRVIYVAADEDEAEFIRGFGFVATCCAGGAGNWRPEHSPFLQGADVVLYNGAKLIAQNLAPIVRRLRILDFANDNVEELIACTAAAKDYAPADEPVTTPATAKPELEPGANPPAEKKEEPAEPAINPPRCAGEQPQPTPVNSRLVAALDYAERGWAVFPAPRGTKKSHKSAEFSGGVNWGATRDPKQIKKDFRKWPDANIGIPTGADNGIVVVETDTPKGHNVDGNASLWALEEKHGPLPETLMAESPSGSRHRYFNQPDGVTIINSASVIAPGIDVRGEGGMVIAPPSVRNDGAYRWLNDHPIADAPQWLIDLASNNKELNLTQKSTGGNSGEAAPEFEAPPGLENVPFEYLAEGIAAPRTKLTAQELLTANGIHLKNYNPGNHTSICPQCSQDRKKKKTKCLSVRIDDDGACWHCHHCGWIGPEKGQQPHQITPVCIPREQAPSTQDPDFEATYDYPGFQKVRFPKGHEPRFLIRHRDPSSNRAGKGWNWGASGADTTVLYRKDEIDEAIANGYEIVLVEGEKDADRLWSIGIPATCSAHGAARPNQDPKWTIEHSKQLAGADIVVLGDHDAQGYAHQDATCKTSLGIAKRVRILKLADHWPEIKEGNDVSDYLDAGHAREQLDELIAKAPDYVGTSSRITATPHRWRDPTTISPRDFLYGDHIVRGYVTGDVSMGGVGKTSEAQVEIAAMVTGRDLLGVKPKHPYRVWYINLEDPQEEIDRRFAAIFKHYGITEKDLGNRLFTDSGREKNFVVARDSKDGIQFNEQIIADIENTIRENAIDAAVVDPYVNCAHVPENDNNKMAAIIKTVWAKIAEQQNCAILLEHHVRKGAAGNDGYTVEDARGAGALINSWRMVRVFNTMTKDEGEKAGVERHRSYFRIDNGKVNLTQPPEKSEWRKFVSIDLENAKEDCPSDRVGVVTQWKWPDPMEDLTIADLCAAQKTVNEGGPWRADSQAKDWVGKPIAAALHLDLDSKADKARIKGALKIWIANGAFKEVENEDAKRKKRTFIEVGTWQTRRPKPSK